MPYASLLRFFCQERLVGAGGHERCSIGGCGRLETEQPPRAIGVFIEQFRFAGQRLVVSDDLSRQRTVDIGCGLDGFNHRASLARLQRAADIGYLDEDQIAKRALRMISDADLDRAILRLAHPLVAFRVLQIAWYVVAHIETP